jgi:hypothetical protein
MAYNNLSGSVTLQPDPKQCLVGDDNESPVRSIALREGRIDTYFTEDMINVDTTI